MLGVVRCNADGGVHVHCFVQWSSLLDVRRASKAPLAAAALLAVSLLTPGASAQRVSLGAVVGGYANCDFDSRYVATPGFPPAIVLSDCGGYVVGPSFDVRVFPRLSLGVEALYKPLRYKAAASFQDGVVIGFAPATTVTWQFPVLAKYRFSLGRVRPFLEGGPSFRTVGNPSADPSHFGVTAGVGVETEWGRLRIAPRVRYTRWAEDPWHTLPTRSDQLEFLVGASYAAASDAHPLGRRIALGAVLAITVSADFPTATETMFDPWTGSSTTFQTSSGPRRPGVGPLVEVSLSARFSLEGNAISRSIRGATRIVKADSPPPYYWASRWPFASGAFWEFPVLLKYRLTTASWRPFLAVGPSFRLPKEIGGAWLSNYGATAGAGIEIQLKRVKLAPSVRYTHWGPDRPRVAGTQGDSGVFRNQMQVLVGASF